MAIQYLNGINVSGDVGIGTTTPYKTLDVQGEAVVSQNLWIGPVGGNSATNSLEIGRGRTGNGICFIDMTTDNTTYTDYGFRLIRFSGVNSNTELIHRGTGDFRIKGQEASNMRFYTGNSARMSITSSGNVGIGTTSPQTLLHLTTAMSSSPTTKLYLDVDGSNTNGGGSEIIFNTSATAGTPTAYNAKITGTRVSGGTGGDSQLGFWTTLASDSQNPQERMTITKEGNVGIGTTSPDAKLEVSGGVFVNYPNGSGASLKIGRSDNSNYWQVGHAGDDFRLFNTAGAGSDILLDIDNGGNSQGSKVGIGTASPDAKLRVNYDENTGTAFKVTGGGSGNPIASFVRDIGASGTINIHASNAHPQISFGNTSTTFAAGAAGTQFRISHSSDINTNTLLAVGSGGNVGIGTTSPTARLHVADAGNPTILIEDTVDSNQVRTTYKNTDFTMVTGLHGTNKTYRIMAGDDFNTTTNRIANFDGNNLRVSIGNVTPARKLHIIGDNNIVARFDTTTASTGALISFVNSTSTNDNQVKLGADPGDGNKLSLWSSNTKTMTLSNGNVGIGTDSPGAKLDVDGAIVSRGGSYSVTNESVTNAAIVVPQNDKIYCETSGGYLRNLIHMDSSNNIKIGQTSTSLINDMYLSTGNSGIIRFETTGSESMRINSAGRVGIGTTSPQYQLHSYNEIGTQTLKLGYGAGYARITTDDASKPLDFQINGSTKMSVNQNGNVGIGTTSQVGKLSVYRTDTTYAASLSEARSRSSLYLKGSGNFDSELTFSSGSSNVQFIQAVNNAATSGRDIAINPFGGDVGIGTTSPSSKLQVAGTVKSSGLDVDGQANSSTNFLQYTRTDSTQPASISYDGTGGFDFNLNGGAVKFSDTNSGSVGIGTTSPGEKLHISGGNLEIENNFPSLIINSDNASGVYNQILSQQEGSSSPPQGELWWKDGNQGGSSRWTTRITSAPYTASYINLPHNSSGGNFAINIENNERLTIDRSNGKVGIGNTNPGYNLDVTGTARITSNMWLGSNIYHDNDGNSAYIGFPADDTWRVVTGGSERLRVNPNGNVGIGVTGPSYALDVNGTVDATSFRAGGISKYTTYNSTNTYENYGTSISNIASSPVGYLYHDLLAFNYNYTVTQESLTYQGSWQSETLDKRLFSQKQDQAITVVSSSEYAVRWTVEGTAWNNAKFINLAFTYTNPHPETRVIIESSADGTTWTSRHDSTASGITGTKSCYVSSWSGNNYVRITVSKTSNNTDLIKLSSIKMMTARAGDQGDGMELQYPYVWDEDRNIGLLLTKSDTPTSKLDILGATNTSNSSLLRLRSTSVSPNAQEKVAAFYYNTNTERGYIGVNQYGVTYSTSSDYRLKENVVPLSDATDRLKLLKPCRFNFIGGNPNYAVDGFLAHEAAEVVPESVNGEKDAVDENNEPIYQGIDQGKIVPLLTAALQEAIEKIEQLESRIQTLENN